MKRRLRDGECTFSEMAKQPCTCGKAITAKYRLFHVVQLVLLTGLLECSLAIQSSTLRIGFLSSDEKMPQLEREIYGALLLAAENINSLPQLYRNISFSIERRLVSNGHSQHETLQELFHSGVATVFSYADICEQVAFSSATWNRLMISPVCGQDKFSDKNKYPTFLRTRPSHAQVTQLLARLTVHYKLNSAAIIIQNSSEWRSIFESFERQALAFNITTVNKYFFNDNEKCCKWQSPCCGSPWSYDIYKDAGSLTKAFLFFGDYKNLKQFSRTIETAEAADAEKFHVFSLEMEAFSSRRIEDLGKRKTRSKRPRKLSSFYEQLEETSIAETELDARVERGSFPESILVARSAHDKGLIQFTSRVRGVIRKVFPPSFDHSVPQNQVTIQAAYAYDALVVYAKALAALIDLSGPNSTDVQRMALDGKLLFGIITEQSNFSSVKGGSISFDSNGDTTDSFSAVGTKKQTGRSNKKEEIFVPIGSFKNNSYHPFLQLNRVTCGHLFSEATVNRKFSRSFFFISYAILNLLIVDMVLHLFLRTLKRKVKNLDGIVIEDGAVTEEKIFNDLRNTQLIRIVDSKVSNHYDSWRTPAFCSRIKTAGYKALVQHDAIWEIGKMRALRHPNIATFFTAVVRSNELLLVSEYQDLGTLEEVLSRKSFALIPSIAYSLVNHLVHGMIYLHESHIIYHGNLKSSTCLVSSGWGLKITGFGIQRIRQPSKSNFTDLLWTAPEILRNPDVFGSQEGDVYSFALIVHELLYRLGPFAVNISHKSPEEIVRKVQNNFRKGKMPYRPPIGRTSLPVYHPCMIECWAEDPGERPRFRNIAHYLEKQVLRSEFVTCTSPAREECIELHSEIDRLEEVLHDIIPKTVANQLAAGKEIEPEIWENVTVFEADLVRFTEMAHERTPLGTLLLLDDLYRLFDSIARAYDVCKMETEGDAYIVTSRPGPESARSAGEIASMALEFVEELKKANIFHKGRPVMMRIGIHTGSVAAGVVGPIQPAFSIFGETAKIASHMQSTSAELRIQLSETTYRALQEIGGYITEERYCEISQSKQKTYWLIDHNKQTMRKNRKQSLENLTPLCNRQSIISLSSADMYVKPLKA